jgi:hypothetical protein
VADDIARLRYEVEQTKVSLAFGLDGEGPSQQEVYAFLPVRRYGLNFMVQVRRWSGMNCCSTR